MTAHRNRAGVLVVIAASLLIHACGRETELDVAVLALDTSACPAGSNIIEGTPGNDTISGTAGPDCIFGYGGDDVIDAGGGDDFIVGGEGSDDLTGGNGADTIYGDEGDDTIAGSNGPDTIHGGDGNDIITGDNGPDTVDGGNGNDVVLDSRGPLVVDPGAGTDSCSAADCELPPATLCATAADCAAGQRCAGRACVYCQSDSECDDGLVCTGVESCVPLLDCQDGVDLPAGFDLGLTCATGIGACSQPGSVVCDGSGSFECDAVPGRPTPDTDCDLVDDDCDGDVDDDFVGTPTLCGRGACVSTGMSVCGPFGEIDSCIPLPAGVELCDGLDNDCDGIIDNGVPLVPITCGAFSCARTGFEICLPGRPGTPPVVYPICRPRPPRPEVCDAIDNDCDGTFDEGTTTMPESGFGCDGIDNDCDGLIDLADSPGPVISLEVCDGIDNDCNGLTDDGLLDSDGDTLCDGPAGTLPDTEFGEAPDRCPFHPDATVVRPGDPPTDIIMGSMFTQAPDVAVPLPIPSLPVSIGPTMTDCRGTYAIAVPRDSGEMTSTPIVVGFSYATRVPGPDVPGLGDIFSRVQVVDDLGSPWGTASYHSGYQATVGSHVYTDATGRRTRFIAPIVIGQSESELFRIAVMIADDYQRMRRRPVPNEILSYMRRHGIIDVGLYAEYDTVINPANVLSLANMNSTFFRESTLFHESGHVFRHVLDGDHPHWDSDLFRFRYGRCHLATGTEITEEGYAFNEGWADYWNRARYAGNAGLPLNTPPADPARFTPTVTVVGTLGPGGVPVPPTTTNYCDLTLGARGVELTVLHLDWVEVMVADRLLSLANRCAGVGPDEADSAMLQVLEANRGRIHRLWEFESALCLSVPACCSITRADRPDACPPGFTNRGETCDGEGRTINRPAPF